MRITKANLTTYIPGECSQSSSETQLWTLYAIFLFYSILFTSPLKLRYLRAAVNLRKLKQSQMATGFSVTKIYILCEISQYSLSNSYQIEIISTSAGHMTNIPSNHRKHWFCDWRRETRKYIFSWSTSQMSSWSARRSEPAHWQNQSRKCVLQVSFAYSNI